jgi:RNA polymerase sigma factor (sigma-70 family)
VSSDADLVRRCLAGDRAAWTALLARYSDLAYALLRRSGLDGASADDAFQEVAILLWRNLRRLRDVERLASWIGTTTRRVAWRERKRARSRDTHEAKAARDNASGGTAPDERAGTVEEEQALREALAGLGERCRELLSLLYFQSSDLTYDEIARRMGLPRGSLGPTRQRCLEALRGELDARGISDEPDEPAPDIREHPPAPASDVSATAPPASARTKGKTTPPTERPQ